MSSGQQEAAAQTRERLIESHLPLVKALARRYAGPDAELDDLVQVGAVGLIKASDRFDPDKGVAFATFATPTIEGEIRHHLRDRRPAMRIPRQLQHLGRRVHRCQADLTVTLGRSPTLAEVAAALEVSVSEVEQALVAERARDAVPLPELQDGEPGAEESAAETDDRLTLASSMRSLSERERQIVHLRFHADKTERQIAQEMGISQAHVSRLLAAALAKLRQGLEAAGDITPEQVISPPNRRQKQAKRRAGTGRSGPAADVVLRAAIAAWSDAERTRRPTTKDAAAPGPPAPGSPDGKPGKTGHSGRFLVRMPSTLHQQLAQAAEREQVSLNRFVTDALATTVSPPADPAPAPTPSRDDAPAPPPPARTIRMVLAANLAIVVLSLAVAAVLLVLALQRGL